MLNGKFYTGLPPKMIDRGNAGGGRNRLESHLFWPDDTKTETATESRIKRRNSVQLAAIERPFYEKHNSVIDDVDTRKRFSKEFSQSSIQFYDNLNENSTPSRRSMLRNSTADKKLDITEKPTNIKLNLADSVVNEASTAAKKKQAYTSKIEFYDYANDNIEPHSKEINFRKPKMDMNDKREMELNSKNSPKLQMKRDVRSLSEEKEQYKKMNNHEMRNVPNKIFDLNERRERILNNEENYLRSRRSVEPRMNASPTRSLEKTNNNRYSYEREIYRDPMPQYYGRYRPRFFRNSEEKFYRRRDEEPNVYESGQYFSDDYENFEDKSFQRLKRQEPRRSLKNNTRNYYEAPDENTYEDEEITNRMRNVSLKSKQPQLELYTREENYYDGDVTPTSSRNSNSRNDYIERGGDHHYEDDLPFKNSVDKPKRFGNNKPPVHKINNQFQRKTPVASPTSPPASDAESSISYTKFQKHLRSNLCFSNGEIIGEMDEVSVPTSSQNSTQKRNARSSATQRVSVGLPN